MLISFIILLAILPVIEWVYITFARKAGFCAQSPDGSSCVPVGGGIIFYIGATLPLLVSSPFFDANIWLLLAGGAVLGVLSFADDMVKLPPLFRLVVQFAVLSVVLVRLFTAGYYDIYLICVIACVGFANASNFMDGINGMLAAYSAVVLLTLEAVPFMGWPERAILGNMPTIEQIQYLLGGLLTAVAVFAVFNMRSKAKVFAGDVGSVGIGYFIGICIVWMSIIYRNVSMPIVVLIYMTDTFCTFLQRLFNGENVLQSHSKHLYQLLTRHGIAPLKVAGAYACIQLVINAGWLATPRPFQLLYSLITIIVVVSVYITIKIRLHKN